SPRFDEGTAIEDPLSSASGRLSPPERGSARGPIPAGTIRTPLLGGTEALGLLGVRGVPAFPEGSDSRLPSECKAITAPTRRAGRPDPGCGDSPPKAREGPAPRALGCTFAVASIPDLDAAGQRRIHAKPEGGVGRVGTAASEHRKLGPRPFR